MPVAPSIFHEYTLRGETGCVEKVLVERGNFTADRCEWARYLVLTSHETCSTGVWPINNEFGTVLITRMNICLDD